jgi:hypothetical protein
MEDEQKKGQGELFEGKFPPPQPKDSGEDVVKAEECMGGNIFEDTLFEKNLRRGIVG